jgi:hypothetical protein
MEPSNQQGTPRLSESEPILQLNRSLIPLKEYAAREGVSESIIYECSKLGIVQIRKCKGRIYVVDVPLSPHMTALEEKIRVKGSVDGSPAPIHLSEKIKEFSPHEEDRFPEIEPSGIESGKSGFMDGQFKQILEEDIEASIRAGIEDEPGPGFFEPERPGKGTSLIHDDSNIYYDEYILEQLESSDLPQPELKQERSKLQDEVDDEDILEILDLELAEPVRVTEAPMFDNKPEDVMIDEPIRIPDLETPSQSLERGGKAEGAEEKALEEVGVTAEEKRQREKRSVIQSRRFWQVTTSFAFLLFLAAVCLNVWVYNDYKAQQGRLGEAYASIQNVYGDFIEQKRTSETLQKQLKDAEASLLQLQNELGQSDAQIKTLQEQLNQNQQSFQNIQGFDSEGVQKLEEQIQKLTTQIEEIAGN